MGYAVQCPKCKHKFVLIITPFPSIKMVAKAMGVSMKRVKWLEKIVDKIQAESRKKKIKKKKL